MQNDTQLALSNSLATLAPLTTWLYNGANSMFAEGDPAPDVPAPFLIFQSGGSRTQGLFRIEVWTVRLYTRSEGYYDLETMLDEIYKHLKNTQLDISPTSYWMCLNDGVRYISTTMRNYDQLYKAENQGIVFEVHLLEK